MNRAKLFRKLMDPEFLIKAADEFISQSGEIHNRKAGIIKGYYTALYTSKDISKRKIAEIFGNKNKALLIYTIDEQEKLFKRFFRHFRFLAKEETHEAIQKLIGDTRETRIAFEVFNELKSLLEGHLFKEADLMLCLKRQKQSAKEGNFKFILLYFQKELKIYEQLKEPLRITQSLMPIIIRNIDSEIQQETAPKIKQKLVQEKRTILQLPGFLRSVGFTKIAGSIILAVSLLGIIARAAMAEEADRPPPLRRTVPPGRITIDERRRQGTVPPFGRAFIKIKGGGPTDPMFGVRPLNKPQGIETTNWIDLEFKYGFASSDEIAKTKKKLGKLHKEIDQTIEKSFGDYNKLKETIKKMTANKKRIFLEELTKKLAKRLEQKFNMNASNRTTHFPLHLFNQKSFKLKKPKKIDKGATMSLALLNNTFDCDTATYAIWMYLGKRLGFEVMPVAMSGHMICMWKHGPIEYYIEPWTGEIHTDLSYYNKKYGWTEPLKTKEQKESHQLASIAGAMCEKQGQITDKIRGMAKKALELDKWNCLAHQLFYGEVEE